MTEQSAPDQSTPEPAEKEIDLTVSLMDPIMDGNGKMVRTLTFRPPTGADLVEIGVAPVRFEQADDGAKFYATIANTRAMNALIARLSNMPTFSIEKIGAADWMACAYKVASFFLPGWKERG